MKTIALIICCLIACGFAAAAPTTQPDKLWARDLPTYMSDHPGNWIVARSQKPALSAQEADLLACSEAAQQLVPIVVARLAHPPDAKTLATRIEASIFRDNWVVDRQIEMTERPYGTIWNAAVLVDASPKNVDSLVRQIEHQTRERHARAVACVFALMILAAIVAFIYTLLNWLTRGFFRGRLAIASVLIIASAVFGIVHLI